MFSVIKVFLDAHLLLVLLSSSWHKELSVTECRLEWAATQELAQLRG
jgi:hypothetical protein